MEFDYSAPASIAEAVDLLSQHGPDAALLAGGTDILVQLRENHRSARHVIDVKKIDELRQLTLSDGSSPLVIGASVPCTQFNQSQPIIDSYGAVSDSTAIIGGWQIQTRASIGGNLCNASPAADSIPPLIVHQAVCHVSGPSGSRTIHSQDFCVGPGKNALEPGELLVSIELPAPRPNSQSAYLRFIPRNEMDIAVAGVAAYVELDEDGQRFVDARVALGAVGPTPILVTAASDALIGQAADVSTIREAGRLAREAATPISDMRGTREYRLQLADVLTRRALATAVERARQKASAN